MATERAAARSRRMLDELAPAAHHGDVRSAHNPTDAEHGRVTARRRRGLTQLRSTAVVAAGHTLGQHLRRGHHAPALAADPPNQLTAACTNLTLTNV